MVTRPFWVFVGSGIDVKRKFGKSKLTELFRARDASCPKGKKMGYRKNLTNRDFSYSNKYNENILFNK